MSRPRWGGDRISGNRWPATRTNEAGLQKILSAHSRGNEETALQHVAGLPDRHGFSLPGIEGRRPAGTLRVFHRPGMLRGTRCSWRWEDGTLPMHLRRSTGICA
jgi:hypothetical protein